MREIAQTINKASSIVLVPMLKAGRYQHNLIPLAYAEAMYYIMEKNGYDVSVNYDIVNMNTVKSQGAPLQKRC